MKFDDGTEGDVPHQRVADATKDGGRITTHMYFNDGTETWVPLDRVHDAIKDGGTLGYRAAAPKTTQPMSDAQTASIALGENDPLKTGYTKAAGETLHTLGAAAGKVLPNSWRDAIGLPSSFKEPDYLQSTNGAETAGKVAENIAEFVMGDEALKGLQITERIGLAQKMASMAKANPYVAKIFEHGLTAIRGGAVTTPQQMAHGATPTEALKTGGEAILLGAGTGAAIEGASALADSDVAQTALSKVKNLKNEVVHGEKIAQPTAQTALRNAPTAASDTAAARAAAQPEVVKVPDEYKDLVHEAMQSGPQWTPAKAQPIVKALGDDFEVRGSVGEGKVTNNDLDIWQKNGELSDAADALKKQGFTFNAKTAHGETWTNEATNQNVDLWDSAHEPKAGFGKDTEVETAEETKPIPAGVRTTLENPIKDIRAQGQSIYRQLDEVSDGQFQKYETNLDKINRQLNSLVEGVDDDRIEILEQKKAEVETSQAQMFDDLKQTRGVDKAAVDTANAHWTQSKALEDLERKVFKNPSTVQGNLKFGTDETVNVDSTLKTLQKMQDDRRFGASRLEQALGSVGADKLLKEMYAAQRMGAHAMKAQQWAKLIAKYALPTAGIAGGAYELATK
jgi:hypothetical protein